MVKTVLHELVKLRGAAIKGHLSMVPIDMKPQPIILAYIDLNLEVIAFVSTFYIHKLTFNYTRNNATSLFILETSCCFPFLPFHYIYYWNRDTDLSSLAVFNNWTDSSSGKDVDFNRAWGPNSLG